MFVSLLSMVQLGKHFRSECDQGGDFQRVDLLLFVKHAVLQSQMVVSAYL